MRHVRAVFPLLFLVAVGVQAEGPDCLFNPEQLKSPREIWRDASSRAELVAPTRAAEAVQGGRRRGVVQPKPIDFQPKNFIDTEIFGKMVKDGIRWTSAAGDEEFLRRVTIDLTGQVPDVDTVKAFLVDPSPNKREAMIDKLIASDAFTDRWTMWMGDHVQNVQFAAATSENYPGRNAYYKYLHDSIAAGKPYDQMVREMIAGAGKSFSVGEVNYWVRQFQNNGPVQDTYDNLAAFSGERFLGQTWVCLSCHNGVGHLELVNSSLAKRTRYDFWKSAAFFANTTRTSAIDPATNNSEMTVLDNGTSGYRLNTTSGNKTPRQPATGQPSTVDPAFFLNGEQPTTGESRRVAFGRMLTANPQFARASVNFIWKELFGFGIVEPAESFDLLRQDPATLAPGATLQPTHPQLLTKLADSFTQNGYSLRSLIKTIVMSNAYQLSSRYTAGEWNELWVPYYARHYPQRLMSEEILDAITRSTGVPGNMAVTGMTPVTRAMLLPDPTEGGTFRNFLNAFGRGNRDDDLRANDSSIVQALLLMNDRTVTDRIHAATNGSTVQKLTRSTTDPAVIAEGLYLATLSRYPSAGEKAAAVAYLKSGDLAKKSEDLQFALLNKIEFLFN